MTLEEFNNLVKSSDKPVFALFSAVWCQPCKKIKPIFEKEAENNTDIHFTVIDIDENDDISEYYRINQIPVLKIFNKSEEKEELKGLNSEKILNKIIEYKKTIN